LNYNVAFEPERMAYSPTYENSLHFSPRFRAYADQLADRLVDKHALRGKHVVEIGCGQGEFLELLARKGENHCVGFDPSYDADRATTTDRDRVSIRGEAYGPAYRDEPADFVCCRHVLEHIARPREFLDQVRQAVGDRGDTVVFFEVPDALYTLRDLGVWDIIYEHCSYFTASSLWRAFARSGFEPTAVASVYDGQFLTIESTPSTSADMAVAATRAFESTEPLVVAFGEAYQAKVCTWRERIDAWRRDSARVVVWGGGSKGVTFLNTLDVGHDVIEHVVDLNPNKQGQFVTGTGQEIVAPSHLAAYAPDVIVIMNPIYRDEIRQEVEAMGLRSQILVA
jgi:SAM-dependent methyltransferase